jgi:hypothetical protein
MIIRVLRPLRPLPRLRSSRPRAAASDRVLPLPARTKLRLSLTFPLLDFLVCPVSYFLSGSLRVP